MADCSSSPGLYEYRQEKPGGWLRTFTIVTTDASRLMEPVHAGYQ
jgi:putative SOS response-associated peptidase YedK